MIPKVIHYCWFGGKPLPKIAVRCIESWKKMMPDCEIKEWNENNYDVHKIPYMHQAYEYKKYAFVADYARFDIINQYGGIYLDIDVEIIKPFNELLESNESFSGFENEKGQVNTGLILASEANNILLEEILNYYKRMSFLDEANNLNLTTVVLHFTEILKRHGLVSENKLQHLDHITIYPTEYFNPMETGTFQVRITENTRTIHHFNGSWLSPYRRFKNKIKRLIGPRMSGLISSIKRKLK
jgi:eps7I